MFTFLSDVVCEVLLIAYIGTCLALDATRLVFSLLSKNFITKLEDCKKQKVVAFFHPYCHAGGGGERVLWEAISALQEECDEVRIIIYSGDVHSIKDIVSKARKTFQIENIDETRISKIELRNRMWVEDHCYPVFTLVGQSIGSIGLAFEALQLHLSCGEKIPDMVVDSMGYPFALSVFKLFGMFCFGTRFTTISYVHYPMISSNMIDKFSSRRFDTLNGSDDASEKKKRFCDRHISHAYYLLKSVYYVMFSYVYGVVGKYSSDIVMTNSTWTSNQVRLIWNKRSDVVHLVYPPSHTSMFSVIPIENEKILREGKHLAIVSVSQFREEKRHEMQLKVLERVDELLEQSGHGADQFKITLTMVGGCRNNSDQIRVNSLKYMAREIEKKSKCGVKVNFKINVDFNELLEELKNANVGIHTMDTEHFGIGIIEMMSSGKVVIAHNSGGPASDIITNDKVGFLAKSVNDYASIIIDSILSSTPSINMNEMGEKARAHVDQKFSSQKFRKTFLEIISKYLF